MTDQLHMLDTPVAPPAPHHPGALAPPAPTGWALKRKADAEVDAGSRCSCGTELATCAGCGQVRCLACEPYLSDDCRWTL